MTYAYIDGGCRGNHQKRRPRQAYGSYKLVVNGIEWPVMRLSFESARTNNEAEYLALINLLEFYTVPVGIRVYTDSNLLVGHLTKGWKANNKLRPYRDKARALMRGKGATLEWVPRTTIVEELGH